MKRERISEKEIAEVMAELSKFRDLEDPPTREEVHIILTPQVKIKYYVLGALEWGLYKSATILREMQTVNTSFH